jgi:hypothetical protein
MTILLGGGGGEGRGGGGKGRGGGRERGGKGGEGKGEGKKISSIHTIFFFLSNSSPKVVSFDSKI